MRTLAGDVVGAERGFRWSDDHEIYVRLGLVHAYDRFEVAVASAPEVMGSPRVRPVEWWQLPPGMLRDIEPLRWAWQKQRAKQKPWAQTYVVDAEGRLVKE